MMFEIWKSIPEHAGYEASNLGQIRSIDRIITCKNGKQVSRKGKVLRPAPSSSGHLSVVLGRGRTKGVHTLVMRTFVGPPPTGMEVLHKNHTPNQNAVDNLIYGTRGQNLQMDYDAGRRRQARPVMSIEPDGKTTTYPSATAAGRAFGINQPALCTALKQGHQSRKTKARFEYVD